MEVKSNMAVYPLYSPYVYHLVKALPRCSKEEREVYLQKSGYNVLRLRSDEVVFDLTTDSHSAAMSNKQLASIYNQEHSPLGFGITTKNLITQLKDVLNYPYLVLTIQGRTGEFTFNRFMVKESKIIPGNTTFVSTRFHQKLHGGIPTNISCEQAFDFHSKEVFKGNIEINKLKNLLETKRDQVAYINIELSCNGIGGYPVSLKNLKAAHELSTKYQIPIILDSTRIVENALMIKVHEPGYEDWSIAKIIREIGKYSDGCIMSLKKSFPVNIGGTIGVRSEDLFYQLRDFNFNLGSDLPEEKIEAISIGIEEALHNDEYMDYHYSLIRRLYHQLKEFGIPVVEPCSSYGVWLDVSEFIKHIPNYENPHIALQNALYVETGIRSGVSELEFEDGTKRWLIRLALPKRLLTESHIDYIASSIQRVYKNRFYIQGYSCCKVFPGIVGHIFATYEPVKPVTSIGQLIVKQANRLNGKKAICATSGGNIVSFSYGQLAEIVRNFACGLSCLGFKKGHRIGFLADNSIESVISYLSTASIGIIDVPIYRIYSPIQIKNVIIDAQVKCLIVSDGELLSKVKQVIDDIPWELKIITIDTYKGMKAKGYTFKEVCKLGEKVSSEVFEKLVEQVRPSDLLSIVYSSGTTGLPKGVMVSHKSIIQTSVMKNYIYDLNESDTLLLRSRVSHAFGRIFLFYALTQGISVWLLGTQEHILEQIGLLKPTIIVAAPEFYESVYQSFTKDSEHSSISLAEGMGGKLRFAISGGTPISEKLLVFLEQRAFHYYRVTGLPKHVVLPPRP